MSQWTSDQIQNYFGRVLGVDSILVNSNDLGPSANSAPLDSSDRPTRNVIGNFNSAAEKELLTNILKAISWNSEVNLLQNADLPSIQNGVVIDFSGEQMGTELEIDGSFIRLKLVEPSLFLAKPELKKAAWALLQKLMRMETMN